MILLCLNSPQNILAITCKVNREWNGCLWHSKSLERLASTRKVSFPLDLFKIRSSSLKPGELKYCKVSGKGGVIRPKVLQCGTGKS